MSAAVKRPAQICGCEATNETEHAVFDLNQRQRDLGITPQCDVNGTLCGESRGTGSGGSGCAMAGPGAKADFSLYLLIPGLFMAAMLLRRFRVKTSRH